MLGLGIDLWTVVSTTTNETPGGSSNGFLLEDGVSALLLEDGLSDLLMET
jgi:hypothetical protein